MAKSAVSDFEQFWQAYPRRVARLAAEKAFMKARKRATLQELLDGIARYKAGKPDYADYCYPATWLNAGRWMDEYERRSGDDRRRPLSETAWVPFRCLHVPECHGRAACDLRTKLDAAKAQEAQSA